MYTLYYLLAPLEPGKEAEVSCHRSGHGPLLEVVWFMLVEMAPALQQKLERKMASIRSKNQRHANIKAVTSR